MLVLAVMSMFVTVTNMKLRLGSLGKKFAGVRAFVGDGGVCISLLLWLLVTADEGLYCIISEGSSICCLPANKHTVIVMAAWQNHRTQTIMYELFAV